MGIFSGKIRVTKCKSSKTTGKNQHDISRPSPLRIVISAVFDSQIGGIRWTRRIYAPHCFYKRLDKLQREIE
jgi:hypothetical protein